MAPPTTGTTARLATVRPTVTLRLDDEPAAPLPAGSACTKPSARASVAVRFTTTAVASAGTPGSETRTRPPAGTRPAGVPSPARVSSARRGDCATYRPAATAWGSGTGVT